MRRTTRRVGQQMPQLRAETTRNTERQEKLAVVRAVLTRFVGQADDRGEDDDEGGPGTALISKPKSETKTPRMYRVIIMNDDYTPMDFVILVLQKFFSKSIEEATQIMLSVHTKGSGVCGTFTFEIAETKVYQVNQFSASNHHPLKCVMEKA